MQRQKPALEETRNRKVNQPSFPFNKNKHWQRFLFLLTVVFLVCQLPLTPFISSSSHRRFKRLCFGFGVGGGLRIGCGVFGKQQVMGLCVFFYVSMAVLSFLQDGLRGGISWILQRFSLVDWLWERCFPLYAQHASMLKRAGCGCGCIYRLFFWHKN